MTTVHLETVPDEVNVSQLHQELVNALGEVFAGLVFSVEGEKRALSLTFARDPDKAVVSRAVAVVQAHHPVTESAEFNLDEIPKQLQALKEQLQALEQAATDKLKAEGR